MISKPHLVRKITCDALELVSVNVETRLSRQFEKTQTSYIMETLPGRD